MIPALCPKCKGTDFTVSSVTLGDKTLYRVLDCKDCQSTELSATIDEFITNRPDLAARYSKSKVRSDYYGTVTITESGETAK